jgi:hypothetical protein
MSEIDSPTIFVHREDELRLANERLSALRAGKPVAEPVLFFHGIPMVGKSTLLRRIRQIAIQNLIPAALIDFADESIGDSGKGRLAHGIMRQWEAAANVSPFEPVTSRDNVEEIASKLVAYANQLHRSARPTPVALFLDTLEKAEWETFSWLQERVIEPLLEEGRIFLALAARAEYFELPIELNWPLSRRTRFLTLGTFGERETPSHLRALKGEMPLTPWQEQLLKSSDPNRLTQGVPGLNEIVFRESFESDEAAVRYLVEEVIFKRVAEGNVGEVRDLLLTMSAFRRMDYLLLAHIAHLFWPHRYPETNRNAGLLLARRMKATTLLEARQDGYGSVISPSLRFLLDNYQRYFEKRRHFETHSEAYRWFGQEVGKGDFVSVTDQIYHLAGAWFDWQMDENNFEYPNDLPVPEANRLPDLIQILENGFERILDKSKADTQVEKALNAFQREGKDFSHFLRPDELAGLIEHCRRFLPQAVQLADDHDNQKNEGMIS